jgi:hypothetical protein
MVFPGDDIAQQARYGVLRCSSQNCSRLKDTTREIAERVDIDASTKHVLLIKLASQSRVQAQEFDSKNNFKLGFLIGCEKKEQWKKKWNKF